MPTVTNLKNYIWVANDTLTNFPSEQKNYDLEYYSDTNNTLFDHMIFGTNSLSYVITTPMSMPTVYSSGSWMRDALKTARISGGTDVENAELIALLEANGTLVPYAITLDLTTIGLGLGEYAIQMSASDDEVSGLKDSDLSAPLQYTQGYNITVTTTNCSQDSTNPRMINPNSTAELHFTFDGTSYVCPETAPTVTSATIDAWQKVDASHGTLVISTATGAVSVTVEGKLNAWDETDLTGTVWQLNIHMSVPSEKKFQIDGYAISGSRRVESTATYNFIHRYVLNRYDLVEIFTDSTSHYPSTFFQQVYTSAVHPEGYRWRAHPDGVIVDPPILYITGGSDATNATAISWFKSNADLISW